MACAGARRAARRPRRKTYYKIRASISLLPAFALVTPRLFALIPCAGTGSRSGSALPKQYRTLAGRALLHYTLAAFDALSEFAQTLVVISPDDPHFDARRFSGLRFAVSRCGGASRQASVLNGLMQLVEFGATDADWVLVHDAARPGITPALIRTLISTLKDDPVGGIVALPVADTLKSACRPVATRSPAPRRATGCGRHRRRRCSASACCARRSSPRSATATT